MRSDRPSTGRRISFWVGLGVLLAGLGLLAYVAWELWGTNIIAHKNQRALTHEVQKEWASEAGCSKFCPKGSIIALIRIPKFGKKYVIPVLEGATEDNLNKGAFAHYSNTAAAGEKGNFAVAGHRITHGEPLRHMPDLRPGNEVIVETRTDTYTYVLDTNPNDLIISFTGLWVLDAVPHNPSSNSPAVNPDPDSKKLITLTTCSELFHTDNRMIAFGHLVKDVKKTKLHPVDP
ncbi:MAG: rane protein [Marmoricola sp.]|nr:rane protein [Marmoricola sp.]